MFIALDKRGKLVDINEATKGEEYICPGCEAELIVKEGSVNAKHFAHKNGVACSDSKNMGEWHYNWQCLFSKEQREIKIGEHRADVVVDDYVIELQHSPLSMEEQLKRINFYNSQGYKVIFIYDCIESYNKGYIRPTKENFGGWYWKYPKAIIDPVYELSENYFLFLDIGKDKLLWVNAKLDDTSKKISNFMTYKIVEKNKLIKNIPKVKESQEILIEKMFESRKIENLEEKLILSKYNKKPEVLIKEFEKNKNGYCNRISKLKKDIENLEKDEKEQEKEYQEMKKRFKVVQSKDLKVLRKQVEEKEENIKMELIKLQDLYKGLEEIEEIIGITNDSELSIQKKIIKIKQINYEIDKELAKLEKSKEIVNNWSKENTQIEIH